MDRMVDVPFNTKMKYVMHAEKWNVRILINTNEMKNDLLDDKNGKEINDK